MWAYTAQRILYAVPIALGVTVVCFCLVYLAPGDPVQMLLPPDASQADVEFLKKLYGFDQPIPIQYFKWLMRAVTGDLGMSLQTSRPVLAEVSRALSNKSSSRSAPSCWPSRSPSCSAPSRPTMPGSRRTGS
jgi:peptide/nickel transport system permease protein